MLVGTKVAVFLALVWSLSFIKDSMSETPNDCKKGKEYWSIDVFSLGTCVSCPRPNWRACSQQHLDDRASCLRSCRVLKSEKPGATTNFNAAVVPLRPTSKAPKVTTNASLAVRYDTPLRLPETNEDNGPKSHGVAEKSLGAEILIVVACVLGLVLVIGAILWYRKKRRVQHRGEGDAEEQMGLHEPVPDRRNDRELQDEPHLVLEGQPANIVADREVLRLAIPELQQRPIVHESCIKQQPIVQSSSGANINEPQHTEELNGSSSLNLDEEEF